MYSTMHTYLNNYLYHVEVCLRYLIPWLCWESGTITLVILQAPTVD